MNTVQVSRAAETLHGLVSIPSISGDEARATQWLQDRALADGLVARHDDAGNLHVHGPDQDDATTWYIGHMDTVPGDIPVRFEDGCLWGRGSVDAKGCIVAAYEALRADPSVPVRLVACVGEESDSPGARQLLALPPDQAPRQIIIGEPSGSDGLTLGYKGIVRATVTVTRPAQHGGHPTPNALDTFMAAWPADLHTGYGFGDTTLRLRDVHSTSDGLEDTVLAWLEVRVPPGQDPAQVENVLRAAYPDLVIEESWPPVQTDRRNPWVARANAALRSVGVVPRPKHKTGTSDWNVLATAWDASVFAYGPGDASLDHGPDERMELADLDRAVQVLTALFASTSA